MFFRLLSVVLLGASFTVYAGEVAEDIGKRIRAQLAAALPTLEINSINKAPVEGLFEVLSKNEAPFLVSADGKYIVAGELYRIEGHSITNVTEQKREVKRVALMASVPEGEKLSYVPKEEAKAKITVFTDIDCAYCRKLHKEVPKLNAMGVRVDYLAYPRAGVGSSSYDKIVSAWCSEDPQGAMTKAKNGEVIPARQCKNPVTRHLELGRRVGVTGTPAIVLDSGKLLPGYAPAEALAKQLGVL